MNSRSLRDPETLQEGRYHATKTMRLFEQTRFRTG
jgi:hypothetical protein